LPSSKAAFPVSNVQVNVVIVVPWLVVLVVIADSQRMAMAGTACVIRAKRDMDVIDAAILASLMTVDDGSSIPSHCAA
jgi:hypothetical protein